jgi:hypothetical protein
MKFVLSERFRALKEIENKTGEGGLRKMIGDLLYEEAEIKAIEEGFKDEFKFGLTKYGREIISSSKKYTRDEIGHNIPSMLYYLLPGPLTVSQIQDRIHLPKVMIDHSLKVMLGESRGACYYTIRGYSCLKMDEPMVYKKNI